MKKFWGMTALLLAASALLFILSGSPALVLKDADTGQVFARWQVKEGSEFSLEFIHSVNQSPILDVFAVEGDQFRAVKTLYSSLGAGVESELSPGESLSYDKEGRMVITGFSQRFKQLNLIVGTVSDHTLTIQGEKLSLRELCGKNTAVTFEIRK